MDKGVAVWAGGPSDSAVAWRIYARAVLEGAGGYYTEAERRAWVPDREEPPWMAERLANGRVWFAGAGVGASPEGLLVAMFPKAGAPVHLDLFFVLPEARGTGVASALLHAFDGAAEGRACTSYASLFLRPILEARGWRVVRPDPTERGGLTLMRYLMERPV